MTRAAASAAARVRPRRDTAPAAARNAIGRRTFLAQSAILSAAAALAACTGLGDSPTAPSLSGGASIHVAQYPSLANVGGIALVSAGGAQLAIARTGAASFVALSRICPHQGGTVNLSGSGFQCPIHGAQFSATGTWTGGQRTSSLHSYATSYDAATDTLSIS